jgi:hypothetical protein
MAGCQLYQLSAVYWLGRWTLSPQLPTLRQVLIRTEPLSLFLETTLIFNVFARTRL